MNKNTQQYFKEILNNMEISLNTLEEALRYDINELRQEHRNLRRFYEGVVKKDKS